MSKKINLLGEVDNFFLALKDRLDRAGALFTLDSEEADITVGLGKYAADESVDRDDEQHIQHCACRGRAEVAAPIPRSFFFKQKTAYEIST